jgi:hypothetical protein
MILLTHNEETPHSIDYGMKPTPFEKICQFSLSPENSLLLFDIIDIFSFFFVPTGRHGSFRKKSSFSF